MVNAVVLCSLLALGVCDDPSCDENPDCKALSPHPGLYDLLRIRLVPWEVRSGLTGDAKYQWTYLSRMMIVPATAMLVAQLPRMTLYW